MPAQQPVLIAGAGLAALLLARSLRRQNIPFQLFERDTVLSVRGQGYRLRLSAEGLDAIEAVLEPPAWRKFWAACSKTGGAGYAAIDVHTGETIRLAGTDGGSAGAGEDLRSRDGKIVGIARGELRALLLEGCEAAVHWGRPVAGYAPVAGGGVHAVFADGSASAAGALLVGAEGLRSPVARQLGRGRLKVYDTGARGIHGQAPARAFAALGEGVFRLCDDSPPASGGGGGGGASGGRKLFVITNVRPGAKDDPDAALGWTMVGQPGLIAAPSTDCAVVGAPAAAVARRLTAAWHPRVRPLFADMVDAEAAFWKITCSAPSGVPAWPNEPRVTVIGDAAHAMTPAGGIGANTALRDAALLGRLLGEAGGFGDGVTAAYEKEMRVYASEAVAKSYAMASSMFGFTIDESTTPTITDRY